MVRRTSLQCPKCKIICVSPVCESSRHSGNSSVYRVPRGNEDSPCYFARVRRCSKCEHKWKTAELPLDFVNELLIASEQLESNRKVNREEEWKRQEELVALKAKFAALYQLHTEQARLLGDIQAMLPLTHEEWLASQETEMRNLETELRDLGITF